MKNKKESAGRVALVTGASQGIGKAIARAQGIGYAPTVSFKDGIKGTVAWFMDNKDSALKRYNVFYENRFVS